MRFSEQFAQSWGDITWILQGAYGCRGTVFAWWSNCRAFFFPISPQDVFFLSAWRQNEIHFSAVNTFVVHLIITFLLSCFPRFYPYVWRQFKREEWDNRKPRISIWISKWSELYLGDRCWRGKQDSYSFSVLRSRGGIWFFISLWWASTPSELQNKVRTRFLIVTHPKMWCGAEK